MGIISMTGKDHIIYRNGVELKKLRASESSKSNYKNCLLFDRNTDIQIGDLVENKETKQKYKIENVETLIDLKQPQMVIAHYSLID